MTTKILGNQITSYTIDTVQLSNTATAAFAKTLAPKVLYANVANSLYFTVDDTAVNVGGGYIVVTGAEFQSGATVLIDTTPASAVTYVNSTTLRVQVPTKSAASYNLYVVNPDGGVGIKVSGITYSSEPTWVTSSPLANQSANTAFGVNLSATSATSYSVAAGSTLPAGTTLAANGYFSGTVTIGNQTTYTFSIVATDDELQDSTKTFQVTVTVTPQTRLWTWGGNEMANSNKGWLGHNDIIQKSSPTQVGSGTDWNFVRGGDYNFGATKTNGTLWLWGANGSGQLGQNDGVFRSSPVQVAGTTWSKVAGNFTTAAIKTDGTLWLWGRNNYGQLGLNDRVYRSSPVQVAGTTWSDVNIYSGFQSVVAIKTNGTLWAWGMNNNGQLGLGDSFNRSSPVQVGVGTNWNLISAGATQFVIATKTDGTLWSWGNNFAGALGLNIATSYTRSSPTQVGVATNWNRIGAERIGCTATKTDGTLWVWGRNTSGDLGLNDTIWRSSPVQVGSATNWNLLTSSPSLYTGIATKTDGTLWMWGSNDRGQLGANNTIARSSPVQVGSATNWSQIAGAFFAVAAIRSN